MKLIGVRATAPFGLIMELAEGDLRTHLPLLTDRQVIEFARDITAGTQWLHAQNVFHRDLKSKNILLCRDMLGKLCPRVTCELCLSDTAEISDFGISESQLFNFEKATTSLDYLTILAPERICLDENGKQKPFTEKCDVYRQQHSFISLTK